jgi:hypothetical protein
MLILLCGILACTLPAAQAAESGHGGGQGGGQGNGHGGGQGEGSSHGNDNGSAHADTAKSPHGKTAADQLAQDRRLAANLSGLLPAGTDLQTAAAGFRNLGQFVAAVHVSRNLGISFSDLKTRMLAGETLGAAIHDLKPGVNATVVASKALREAQIEIGRQ